jgi:hypothetical protein
MLSKVCVPVVLRPAALRCATWAARSARSSASTALKAAPKALCITTDAISLSGVDPVNGNHDIRRGLRRPGPWTQPG